jgi:hypothetical protein
MKIKVLLTFNPHISTKDNSVLVHSVPGSRQWLREKNEMSQDLFD